MNRLATPDDIDAICEELPETEFGTTWGDVPTWKVPRGTKGRGFVLYRKPHASALDPETGEPYDDVLVVRVANVQDKAALVEDPTTPFFTIDHFRNFNAVLVQQSRLHEVDVEQLRELLTEAWLAVAPTSLIRRHFPDNRLAGRPR